ncbi:hypothetical protein [Metallibacterium scheffleri]|uniref:hypothetical protein n=1 Tax=Metallibacterium scheffleri TaxID=993689 RepID=UPI001F5B572A|nr:hypothetical protein [Metallibacterium scheffleri]
MPKYPLRALLLILVLLALTACSRHAEETLPGGSTPQAAVADGYKLLRDNDIDGLYRHALPPADYAAMRARWGQGRDLSQFSPADRAQFAKMMTLLSAPGAQQLLWVEIKPKLLQARQHYQARLPAMLGMLRTMADTGVQRSTQLTAAEKVQALTALGVLSAWAEKTDWLNPDKVYQVLGVLTGTAQKMSFHTLNEALSMPYPEAMRDVGHLWSGVKQALDVYGLSINTILDTAQIKVLSDDGNVAVVRTTFDVLGTPVTRDNTLIKQDGRWYDRDTLLHWRAVLAKPAPSASVARPASAVAPAGAASTHRAATPAVAASARARKP